MPPAFLLAAWLAAAPPASASSPATARPPASAIPIERGRTNAVVAVADVGAPLERAVPGRAYARAAAADAQQRWSEAEALYREAVAEWNAAARVEPSRALELAVAKAERERQRSQTLATRVRIAAARSAAAPTVRRAEAVDEARLLRNKLMAARAITGRVSPALYARTRARLEDALRAGEPEPAGPRGEPEDRRLPDAGAADAHRWPGEAEMYLLLCATRAVGGEPEAARLARAHVTDADRAEPTNTVALALCAAALGETDAALRALELYALNPGPGHPDRFNLRDLYLLNDWDRLRGDPRFESLFPR